MKYNNNNITIGKLPDIDKVKETFQRVKCNNFYRKKFANHSLKTWNDFERLPFTTIDELINSNIYDLLSAPMNEVCRYHESFELAAHSVPTWLSKMDIENELILTKRWTEKIRPGMLVMNHFPQSNAFQQIVLENKCQKQGGIIVPAGYLSRGKTYSAILEFIMKLKINAIGCLPSEMLLFEAVAIKCGYDLKKNFGAISQILTSGEVLSPALKAYIEKKWHGTISNLYGSTETGGIASSCKYGNLHIHSDAFILEIVTPEKPISANDKETGILAVTSLYRQAMPLFRYITDDYCRIKKLQCPCGDNNPVIEILGKKQDVIKIQNKLLFPYALEQAVIEFSEQFDSALYHISMDKQRLLIRIATQNNIFEPDKNSLDMLAARLSVPFKVQICGIGEFFDILSYSPDRPDNC
ncbi:MAG: hypothetical protein HY738_09075 [Bacteroidia bacterium]|nr:hypothetical protein [Bacteroidia bacterium]